MALVGPADPDNPACISESRIRAWVGGGAVEWWGQREDMAGVYGSARIVCLPSYREGLPKVLLEGAACARPLVATDVPGCREVCRDGETGYLVDPSDLEGLRSAVCRLMDEPATSTEMGRRGRERRGNLADRLACR